jgi:hypothetical protein
MNEAEISEYAERDPEFQPNWARKRKMIYGVTVDDISEAKKTLHAIQKLPESRQVRVVLDKDMWMDHYADFLYRLDSVVDKTILLPVDSSDTAGYTVADFVARYHRWCVDSSPSDIVELNEVNGDWCGPDSSEKTGKALQVIRNSGRQSLLTLYQEGSSLEPIAKWCAENVFSINPTHVGISYYPRQGDGDPDFELLFQFLAKAFPASRLRFSEIGTEYFDEHNKSVPATPATVREIISKYYGMKISGSRFDGFYGWWDFVEQMVNGPYMPDLLARCR